MSLPHFYFFIQPCSISPFDAHTRHDGTPMPICTKRLTLSMVGISMGILSAVRFLANSSMTRRRKGDSTLCADEVFFSKLGDIDFALLAEECFGCTTRVSSSSGFPWPEAGHRVARKEIAPRSRRYSGLHGECPGKHAVHATDTGMLFPEFARAGGERDRTLVYSQGEFAALQALNSESPFLTSSGG